MKDFDVSLTKVKPRPGGWLPDAKVHGPDLKAVILTVGAERTAVLFVRGREMAMGNSTYRAIHRHVIHCDDALLPAGEKHG